MKNCYLCGKDIVKKLLSFDQQPVAHRFLNSTEEKEYLSNISLGQCQSCGLVQQLNPMPVDELRSRYEWLTRNEPERHLDDLVNTLTNLTGITKESKILGVCWKEDSILDRFNKLGYENIYRLKLDEDFEIKEPLSDVETVQERFTLEQSQKIVDRYGKADIVMARHLIEHAFNVQEFLKAIKNLVKPEGYVVLEIPDCRLSMEGLDYTTIWEEHIIYLTPETFKSCFAYGGFQLVDFIEEEYSLENSYIGIARIANEFVETALDVKVLQSELERGNRFARRLETKRHELRFYLEDFKRNQGKVAIFGAAHMCSSFLNLMDVADLIEFAVDDNPHKNGMFMPGVHLPIRGSKDLLVQDIKLCLLTLSVVSEEIVLERNQDFIKKGGIFKSIFPGNPKALTV